MAAPYVAHCLRSEAKGSKAPADTLHKALYAEDSTVWYFSKNKAAGTLNVRNIMSDRGFSKTGQHAKPDAGEHNQLKTPNISRNAWKLQLWLT